MRGGVEEGGGGWKRGRDRVHGRLVGGVGERRRRARGEKEAKGTVGGELWCFHPHSLIHGRKDSSFDP